MTEEKDYRRFLNPISESMNALLTLLRSYFLTGVIVLVPLAATLFIFWQLFNLADGLLGDEVRRVMGYRIPGVGLVSTALACILVGMIAQNVIGRRVLRWIDRSLESVPVVRTLYLGIKQVSDVLFQNRRGDFKRVVLIEYPRKGCWTIAFVTNDFTTKVQHPVFLTQPMVTVFVPTTPNPTSGFLIIIEKAALIDTDFDIEEAMKMVISGGLVHGGQFFPGTDSTSMLPPTIEDFTIPH